MLCIEEYNSNKEAHQTEPMINYHADKKGYIIVSAWQSTYVKRHFGSRDRIELLLPCSYHTHLQSQKIHYNFCWTNRLIAFCPIRWSSFNRRMVARCSQDFCAVIRMRCRPFGGRTAAQHQHCDRRALAAIIQFMCREKRFTRTTYIYSSGFFLLFFCHETDACCTLHTFRAVLNKKDNAKQRRGYSRNITGSSAQVKSNKQQQNTVYVTYIMVCVAMAKTPNLSLRATARYHRLGALWYSAAAVAAMRSSCILKWVYKWSFRRRKNIVTPWKKLVCAEQQPVSVHIAASAYWIGWNGVTCAVRARMIGSFWRLEKHWRRQSINFNFVSMLLGFNKK